MFRKNCRVVKNIKATLNHFVLTLRSSRISGNAKPGQFVQLLCSETGDPLLPRPFSFLKAGKNDFSLLYHVVGKGTEILSKKKTGDFLWTLGPLGNGFGYTSSSNALVEDHPDGPRQKISGATDIILIGGGVGIPPLYHLAETIIRHSEEARGRRRISKSEILRRSLRRPPQDDNVCSRIHVFLGARNQALLLCEKDFKKLGVKLEIATNDGSKGHKGFVTDLLEDFLASFPNVRHKASADPSAFQWRTLVGDRPDDSRQKIAGMTHIYTCGPTPMLKVVSMIAQKYEVPCEVSVEVPMACGFGACLGCAIKIKTEHSHRFAIACTEGPVFQGKDIVW